ncbi:MAG TPA: AAA family ATPase [Terriglobales bacterium]|jgi:pilus assembly protein CpaE|nr:AAA family ATPase [Terriglobales bacterium]
MPVATVGILASESEQLDLLQTVVDAAAAGRTVLKDALPDLESFTLKVRELKPQVLLVDIPARNPAPALGAIERLHLEFPQLAIFACGDMMKRQVIVDAMRSGACEFLDRPPSTHSLVEAFSRLQANRRKPTDDPNRGRVIAVLNAKGGCGATTVAVNLAVALNESHGNSLLMDLAPIGHAALHLNAKPNFGVLDAFQNCHRLDSSLLDGFVTRCDSGVHLLAAPQVPTPLKPAEDEVNRLLDLVVNHYKYVLVDLSSRLDPLVRMVCALSDTILLIAETDMIALLWNAARVQSYLGEASSRDKVRLVLNRFRKTPEFSDADAEAAADARILWKIPSQYFVVGSAIDRGTPVALQKNTDVARSFRGLAALLAQDQSRPARRLLNSEYASRIRAFST